MCFGYETTDSLGEVMQIILVMFMLTSFCVFSWLYSRLMGNIVPRVTNKQSTYKPELPEPIAQVSKNEIIKKLDTLLTQENITDDWYIAVNDLVIDLASIDKNLSNNYLRKIVARTVQVEREKNPTLSPSVQEKSIKRDESKSPGLSLEKESLEREIYVEEEKEEPIEKSESNTFLKEVTIKKLDELLQQEVLDDTWYALVDNLIIDLALVDRKLLDEYLKKIRIKTVRSAQKEVQDKVEQLQKEAPSTKAAYPQKITQKDTQLPGQMQKVTPPPPPAGKLMPKGTPPPPPSGPGMQKGNPPPPPPGAGIKKATPPPPPGPMVKGKKPSPIPGNKNQLAPVVAPKGPQPLSAKELYGIKQLEKRTIAEVAQLFNDLLAALILDKFWDDAKKLPKIDWETRMNPVKKILLESKTKTKVEIDTAIASRIAQVKVEKIEQGLAAQAAEVQKKLAEEQEEFSEKKLVEQIESLKKRTDVFDFAWLIDFQGSVKKLDKVNHEKALEYQNEFIKKFPEQKPFLPKPKAHVVEVKKELTAEEKQMALIDKILNEKLPMWFIAARNEIQQLYDMNPELGLKYQEKYLKEGKKDSGKIDKPFLRLKHE